MSKSEKTLELERKIWNSTKKLGTWGCFEVTIGFYGKERVDYVTYDSNHIWKFYEIKASVSDFYSSAKHSFYGHYNFFVMPYEVYEKVKNDIPKHIGVTDGICSLKKAKRVDLTIPSEELKDYFIRSLQREYAKDIDSKDESKLSIYRKQITQEKKQKWHWHKELCLLQNAIVDKYGLAELRRLKKES